MGGFGGPFSSTSSTRHVAPTISGPVTASGGSAASVLQGGKSKNVQQGAVNLEKGANIGGYTLGNIGRRATVNITQTADTSAIEDTVRQLEDAVLAQTNNAAATTASTGLLGENRNTAPAGLPLDKIMAGSVAAIAAGFLILVAILAFRK